MLGFFLTLPSDVPEMHVVFVWGRSPRKSNNAASDQPQSKWGCMYNAEMQRGLASWCSNLSSQDQIFLQYDQLLAAYALTASYLSSCTHTIFAATCADACQRLLCMSCQISPGLTRCSSVDFWRAHLSGLGLPPSMYASVGALRWREELHGGQHVIRQLQPAQLVSSHHHQPGRHQGQ